MKKTRIVVIALAILMLFAAVSCKDEPVHQHVFDQEVVKNDFFAEEATEESAAKYYKSCKCGEKGEETFEFGEKLDHVYGNWNVSKDPTCTEKGSRTRECTHKGCTNVETEEIAALGHTFGTDGKCTKKGCTAKDEVVQPVVDFIDSTAAYTKVEGYRITGENKSYDLSKENYEEYGYNILTAIIKDLVENEDINKDYLEIKSKKGLITYYEETKNDKNIGTLLTKLEADDVAVEIKYKGINNKISFSFVITEKSQYPVDETSDPSMFTRSIEVESLTLNDKAYKSFTATLGTDDGVNVKFTSATCEGKDVNLDILNAFISLTF